MGIGKQKLETGNVEIREAETEHPDKSRDKRKTKINPAPFENHKGCGTPSTSMKRVAYARSLVGPRNATGNSVESVFHRISGMHV